MVCGAASDIDAGRLERELEKEPDGEGVELILLLLDAAAAAAVTASVVVVCTERREPVS